MKVEILKIDLPMFEKQAALMGVVVHTQGPYSPGSQFMVCELVEDGKELQPLTAYRLASNFQLEIRRLTLEKVLAN